jgi:hypothetical protein
MSEQSSATHGRDEDDAMKREARTELEAHGEEWREHEELGDGEPGQTWAAEGRFSDEQPGEDFEGIALRSDLGRHFGRTAFPASREQLLQILTAGGAEDRLLVPVASLPRSAEFDSLADLLKSLNLPTEKY